MRTSEVIFIFIISTLPCVLAQISLSISAPTIVKPSQNVKFTCHVSGVLITDGSKMHAVNIVRQFSGGRFEFLAHLNYGEGTAYNPSLQTRLSLSRNTVKNEVYLEFRSLGADDSATYYCTAQRVIAGAYFDIWGQGTLVTVTSAESKGPSLFPLISPGTSQEKSTTIGCMAKDFLPGSIDFSWVDQVSNNYTIGLKKYNPVLQSGGTYIASSLIKVPTDGWENNDSYYCNAIHSVKSEAVVLQIPRVIGKKPTVTIHPPMKDDIEINGNGRIVCFASEFYPKNIQISWKKNSEVIPEVVTEEAVSSGNGSFMITSYIVVSKQAWDSDATFSCIVKHDASDFQEMKNVSKSTVCEPEIITGGKIKVTAVPPSFETIYIQNTAPLTCIITNMGNKDGLEVTWYAGDEKINTEIEDPIYDSSIRRYTAKAIATVCPEDWRTKTFKCSVSHPELPSVEVVTIKKTNGDDVKAPIVLLYPPHPDELAKKESATLSCLVKGFNPPNIFVKWMDSNNQELSHVATTGPIQEITSSSKKTYTLLSTLTLPSVQDWNSGKAYTCIVGHESLPLHTTQRTIDKTSALMIYIEEDDDIDNLWTTASTFIVLFLLSLFYSATVTLFKVK